MDHRKFVSLVIFSTLLLCLSCQDEGSLAVENRMEEIQRQSSGGDTHMDHTPKHGGFFFMTLDYVHHLEGTLNSPRLFRVYLYDARTQPLDPRKVKEAQGTLHWGEFPDPPGIPLKIGEDERTLVAELDGDIAFPLALTLSLHLPGNDAGAEPELFNFVFNEYSKPSEVQE